jgi:hypothetical protein
MGRIRCSTFLLGSVDFFPSLQVDEANICLVLFICHFSVVQFLFGRTTFLQPLILVQPSPKVIIGLY